MIRVFLGAFVIVLEMLWNPAYACAVIVEDWAPALALTTTESTKVHDLLSWNGRLWIAQGSGLSGQRKTLIRSYDIGTDTLTTEFEVPVDTYTGSPYWRVLEVFNGELYAGLGNNLNAAGTGDIYKFDGISWTKVLDTTENDVYALEVYNGKIYAGAGSDGLGAGKLYESSDGNTWTLIKTFTSDFVRSLQEWQGRLYIGLRDKARLWSYDGMMFVDHGAPPGIGSQIKSLVPYQNRLYLSTVQGKIFSWDGSAFTLELASATDGEIYKGAVYAGCLFFPTSIKKPNLGGSVWKFDGFSWTLDYVDTQTSNQFQVVQEYAGYLWVGGGKRRGIPLSLRRTLQQPAGITP